MLFLGQSQRIAKKIPVVLGQCQILHIIAKSVSVYCKFLLNQSQHNLIHSYIKLNQSVSKSAFSKKKKIPCITVCRY